MNKFKVGQFVLVKMNKKQYKGLIHSKSPIGYGISFLNGNGTWAFPKQLTPIYRGTAELKLTRSGEYRFTLKGKNGEVVATSHGETYTRKAKCFQTLKRLFPEFEVIDKTVKKK